MSRIGGTLRANGLASAFWVLFVAALIGQDVAENWQSEYLQFFLYIVATVYLVQRGSPESRPLGQQGRESDREQKIAEHAVADSPASARSRGLRLTVFSRSLGLVMGLVFLASWTAQSIAGRIAYDEQLIGDLEDPISWLEYVFSSDFWSRTRQTGSPSPGRGQYGGVLDPSA